MAQYDVTGLRQSYTLSTTPSTYTNSGASYTTCINTIYVKLQKTGATTRTVDVYVNGTGVTNELMTLTLVPSSITLYQITDAKIILNNTDTLSFKVDAGTDVNVYMTGTITQIA